MKRIINEQYERAKDILRKYAAQHNRIRDLLVEREVIFHDDVEEILGKRPWKSRTDEIMEINKKDEERKAKEAQENDEHELDSLFNKKPKPKKPVESGEPSDEDPGTPPPFTKE